MTKEIVKHQTPAEILGVDPGVFNSLSPLASGWLTMAAIKVTTFNDLQADELAVQGDINKIKPLIALATEGVPYEDLKKRLADVQTALADARSTANIAKGKRLYFTNELDVKLITPAMQFEKRSEIIIKEATADELNYRIRINAIGDSATRRETERNELKTHIINEWYRVAAKYRADLAKFITDGYTTALKEKRKPKELAPYLEAIRGFMNAVELDGFIVFTRILVTDDEAMELFNSIKGYDGADDLATALKALDTQFAMYDKDLKNADAAIETATTLFNESQASADKDLKIEMATNNLNSNVGVSTVSAPVVKRDMVVIEENSDAWASAVLGAFHKHWNDCRKFIRVATWSKLSIGQMATALGKLATENGQTSIEPGKVYTGIALQVVRK